MIVYHPVMTRHRVRPTFEHELAAEPDAFFSALKSALGEAEGRCRGVVFGEEAILRVRNEEREIWSPALHLHVERDVQGSVALRGQFAPSSPVWTAFVGIYIALLCVLTIATPLVFQRTVFDAFGMARYALCAFPIFLVLARWTPGELSGRTVGAGLAMFQAILAVVFATSRWGE